MLFSGTLCQISSLKKVCANIDTTNLYCIDIVCHGAPRADIWKKYLSNAEKNTMGKSKKLF